MSLQKFVIRFIVLLLMHCFFQTESKAQKIYGHEWIRTYQPYFKIKITQKGLYRIDSTTLQSWFNQDPRRFQLFRNGIEQALYIQGEADGILHANDFIEFFAEPNDGLLDKELFRSSAEQAQTFRSMFSDTAVYYLTVLPDTVPNLPLRVAAFNDNDYGAYTAEPRYEVKRQMVPQEDYYYGSFLPADQKYYLSEYGEAEGMMSTLIGQGQNRIFTFQTPAVATGQNAQIEIKLIGASDFFLADPNLPNHHVKIWVIPNVQTPILIIDTTFRGYGERKFNRSLSATNLGDSTRFYIEVVNDIAVGSDFVGVSYLQLSYQKNNLNTESCEELQLNPTQVAAKTLVQLNGFSGNEPLVWDLKNRKRAAGTKNAGNAQALLPYSAESRKLILQDAGSITYLQNLKPQVFVAPNPAQNYQYLIVSNHSLQSSAENYQNYRAQKYTTYLTYAEDLSDYFTYGQFHPLAIRRFCQYLFDKQNQTPQFLLLMGRGYQNSLLKANWENNALNLVPAIGVPSSDHLFTSGFLNNTGAPAIATGRIPAANNTEANNYLQKVIYYETHPDSIQSWRKNYLHLSGGSYEFQQDEFRQKLSNIGQVIRNKPVGANIFSYYKTTTDPTDGNLAKRLIGHLNSGIHMMTFYGHGSLTVLDMDFGGIKDLQPNNRSSFYYFNGCNIGNANDVDPLGTGLVYGKDYICAANKGAIGWLAHTNLTFTNHLEYQMDQLYQQMGIELYGKPVGLQLKKALEITSQSNDAFARSHALQILLQGDPALVLYSPALPDYQIGSEDLFIYPNQVSVQNDSMAVGIILHNLAKAIDDSLQIQVSRKLPDNTQQVFKLQLNHAPYYSDTVFVWIKPLLKKEIGLNTFTVNVNPDKKINEINYANNEASFDFFLPGSGVQALLPNPYEIIRTDSVELLVQNNNLFTDQTEYIFEIDTGLGFSGSSAYYRNSGPVLAKNLARWITTLSSDDSMVYYWRAKLNLPENQGGVWVTQSFIHIKNGPSGWHQQRYEQVRNSSSRTFIEFNDSLKKMEFSSNTLVLSVENRRWDHRGMGVIFPYLLNAGVGSCISQGTVVLVFEPFQVDFPYELPNYPFNCAFVQSNKSSQSIRYYPFNTNTLQGEQELARLIDSVPNGYYVAMFSRYSSNIPNWSPNTKSLFAKLGSNKIEQVKSLNTAWVLLGQKGEAPGLAVEDTVINNELENAPNLPPLPADPQDVKKVSIKRNIQLKWYTGNFVSAPVGPATQYHSLKLALRDEDPVPSGRWWLNIIGTQVQGTDTLLFQNINSLSFDLSSIDAKKFPFLKLQMFFVDSTYRTPQQIHFWQVNYEGAAELSVDINSNYSFHSESLEQGDSLVLTLPFINVGRNTMDSSDALLEILDDNRQIPYSSWQKLPPLLSGESYVLKSKIPTFTLSGLNSLQVNGNANKLRPEANYFNNFYKKTFTVNVDVKNPFLEVTFDGQRIVNGDIVSPNPLIRISSTDKNVFILQKDTGTFELYLRSPKEFDFERINIQDPRVQFIPASDRNEAQLLFEPKGLSDGLFTLKVQALDASGNKAGAKDFEVDFNVINKSSITHFYPYPNPFTTHMRFVFTLTGAKVPDQLLVRIMTINGKLVREVRKEEFGSIHIGNNISEFVWDGSDMYGDKLANGIYLYQVYTRIEGKEIESRSTKAKDESSYFVNGTGKIFLMR